MNAIRSLATGLAAATLLAPTGAAAAPASATTRPVLTIPPPAPPTVIGSSTVVRTDNGVSARLEASGLPAGHVVTLWIVVANAPEECEAGLPGVTPCGPADHPAGRGQMSVHHGSGRVVGDDGTASYGAHLSEGDTSRVAFAGEPGLLDARTAEIVLVLKDHGPKRPGRVADQLRTFGGGCVPLDLPPTLTLRPEMAGQPGDHPCSEFAFSPHVA